MEEVYKMIGIISLLVFVMWVLFIWSVSQDNDIFCYIASAGLILISIYIMVNGLEGVDNFVTKGLAVIQIGIGMIGIFTPLQALINENF